MDWALNALTWVGNAYEGLLLLVGAAVLAIQVARAVWYRDLSVFREHPELIVLIALLLLLGLREWALRTRIAQPDTRDEG